jgi:cellulose synthase/poly-beta-1,6-N-acetylglucosamine synthase-like glycosyltransferase
MRALEIAFWLLIGSATYSLVMYPLMIMILSRFTRPRFEKRPIRPRVSLIITAFNEEAGIGPKLANSLALEYPRDRFEILVASDGSTDGTDAIVLGFAQRGVRLLRYDGGVGKSEATNRAVAEAGGEILVFSDATGIWNPGAIEALVEHFADSRVGCVSGRVVYSYGDSPTARGFGVYQRYVLALRRAEATFGRGFNASGSIHALRASLFRPCPPDTFTDMVDPLHTAMQGFHTTFEEGAVSAESARSRFRDEFRARLRIALGAWRFVAYAIPRLPCRRSPMYCFQVISHKLLRWLIGPSLPLILLLNIVLLGRHPIYLWLLAAQALCYGVTLVGLVPGRPVSRIPGVSVLVFFNIANLGYLASLLRYLRGERATRWKPSR